MTHVQANPFKIAFDSLEEFADVISEVLQCPITIEDANHRLLAYSTHDEQTDQARIATIIGRRVPEKVINSLWKEGIIQRLLACDEAIRVPALDNIGLGDRIAISIRNKEDVLGFIWAVEVNKAFTEKEFVLLKEAAAAVKSKLLQLQVRRNTKEERSQELFWKLLTGHMKEREEITASLSQLQITPPSSYMITAFQFQEEITREAEKQMLYVLQTNQRVQKVLHTFDRNRLLLCIGAHEQEFVRDFIEQFSCKLRKRFYIKSIQAACSRVYEEYEMVEEAYKEVIAVFEMKERFPLETELLHFYEEMGMYQLFHVLIEARQKTKYENRALQRLHAYDRKHHSDLVYTLEVFLNKDSNVNDAARELNVHPNTLSYRLKRITEIGGVDLKNPNEKLMLYVDLKLEKLA